MGTLVARRSEPATAPVVLPGVREAADRLPGVPLFIVANRAEVTLLAGNEGNQKAERLFDIVHEHTGGRITAARCCPHPPQAGCSGQKPSPGLLTALAAAYRIDLTRAWYVGDTLEDRECARRAGAAQFHWAQTFFAPAPNWMSAKLRCWEFVEEGQASKSQPPTPDVRLAIEGDLPEIVQIYNEAIAERISTCDLEPVTVAARRPWFERFDARHPLYVAVAGEEVVGWSAILPYDPKPGYVGVVEHSIYVTRAARGAGLGRRLLEHLIQTAAALGHRCILGRIFRHNEPSLTLHQRLGFEEAGVLPRAALLDGREADVVFMLRHL